MTPNLPDFVGIHMQVRFVGESLTFSSTVPLQATHQPNAANNFTSQTASECMLQRCMKLLITL